MKKKYVGVAFMLLLFISQSPFAVFASSGHEEAIKETKNIYEPDQKGLEEILKDDNLKPAPDPIPYQEVPKVPEKKIPVVPGGNTKAINPLATKENKARGTVLENVDQNGKDLTPNENTDVQKATSTEDKSIVQNDDNPVDRRQFVTFQTKSGKTMHLIINYGESQDNVMLLTEVGEQDLLNMIEGENPPPKPIVKQESVKVEPEKEVKKEEPKKSSNAGTYFLMVLVLGAVLGGGYYFKIVKGKEEKELENFDEEDYIEEAKEMEDQEEYEESQDDEELL